MAAQVFLHTYDAPGAEPRNEGRVFLRLPTVGEYVTLSPTSDWYEVTLVVHCPFEATYAAEVYARRVDHLEVVKERAPYVHGVATKKRAR